MKTKRPHAKSVENFNRYRFYAGKAAKAEQAGNYEEAETNWDLAMLSASPENKEWAIRRRDFCQRMHQRPFEGE